MERHACGAEDGASVEDGQNFLLRPLHLAVPQFEVAAVFFFPILVQIDQNIDAAVQAKTVVITEVGVHFQKSSGLDLVQSSANVGGVGQHTLNPGQRLKKFEHGAGIEEVENIPDRGRQFFYRIESQFLVLIHIFVCKPVHFFRLRKIAECGFGHIDGEEVIKVNVWVRLVGVVFLGVGLSQGLKLLRKLVAEQGAHYAGVAGGCCLDRLGHR